MDIPLGYSIGKITKGSLPTNQYNQAKILHPNLKNEVKFFKGMFINNFLLHTINYKDMGKRKSCYICYKDAITNSTGYGEIQNFAEFPFVGTIVFVKVFDVTDSSI